MQKTYLIFIVMGVSMSRGKTVLVPLIQHFVEYSGNEVKLTAFRLIAIQSLPNKFWGKD